MTYEEAAQVFTEDILPYIKDLYEQDGAPDLVARREAWNNWTDSLCRDGEITDEQYENWDHPPCCEGTE